MEQLIELEKKYGANNYAPLPVVICRGLGAYVWDINGKRYLDLMSAYSAVSHGHCHPRLVATLYAQAQKLAIISRAFYSDQLAPWLEKVCSVTGMAKVLPMNTGAEAVETAIKAARKWAYTVKGVAKDQAEIIICQGNFHGRTIAVVGMSTEPQYREGFGPFPAGFKSIPYGDVQALKQAITPNTAVFLVEPIQGEAGIIVPPAGYLSECAQVCREAGVLLIADEIQCGLGRSGRWLACMHEHVQPDGLILGKSLGGGLLPISAFLAKQEVMNVFQPGDHGSTFGGNPLATAVSLTALQVFEEEGLIENSRINGDYFLQKLRQIKSPLIKEVRGKGLFIGLEVDPQQKPARQICLQLLERGILTKDTHNKTIRFAPPLVISQAQLDEALTIIEDVLLH